MGCQSSSSKAELRADIAELEALVDALYAALIAGSTEVKGYSLDTGEGKQTMNYRSLSELQTAWESNKSRLGTLKRELNGGGLGSMRFRRS